MQFKWKDTDTMKVKLWEKDKPSDHNWIRGWWADVKEKVLVEIKRNAS